MLRDAIISAANSIANNRKAVDDLNIFPVPDGDTGTNMSMTVGAASKELAHFNIDEVGEVASCAASAMLRGARGNSGVITSLLFRGFAKGLKDKNFATGEDLANAMTLGVEAAYKAVMKPTEGTILTVARIAAEKGRASAAAGADAVEVWNTMCKGAEEALEMTPELLPVLKKVGVVDAGGKGLTLIMNGMKSVFENGVIVKSQTDSNKQTEEDFIAVTQKNAAAEYEGEITFTYCTEFIIERDPKIEKDPLDLRKYLESIGDSVVVVDDEEIIKVHVHTDNPGNAIQHGLEYGMMISSKIENMRKQHEQAKKDAGIVDNEPEEEYAEPVEDIGFVSVAAGNGVKDLFRDLGVNQIVSGGQTMNPSTEDILKAVLKVPAKTVYVLPNNKNIIMAAEQVIPLADRKVIVVPTRTIPQGISAMMAYDPDSSDEENLMNMVKAADHVSTGMITFAARDSEFDGHKIKQNEIMALDNGKLVFTEKSPVKAAIKLTRSLTKKDTQFITILYGEGITKEQANELYRNISSKVSNDVEITMVNGGQPVYYFIISVE